MNAPLNLPITCEHVASEAELIALGGVTEFAAVLCRESAALLAAAASADVVATEVRLWTCRRTLVAAILSWREAVPALSQERVKA